MKVGNFPPEGSSYPIGKWLYLFQIRWCPPYMIGVFKPEVLVALIKVLDAGEPDKIDGRPRKQLGGWRRFTLPFGIIFHIEIV